MRRNDKPEIDPRQDPAMRDQAPPPPPRRRMPKPIRLILWALLIVLIAVIGVYAGLLVSAWLL